MVRCHWMTARCLYLDANLFLYLQVLRNRAQAHELQEINEIGFGSWIGYTSPEN